MITLTDVQKNFNAWRDTRTSKRERIPQALWEQVASIYSSYSSSIICQKLGISGTQLKMAMLGDGFASFAPVPSTSNATSEPSICEVSLERLGSRLTIKVPMHAFEAAVTKLSGYLPC